MYNCKCYKCQENFESENELDTDEYSYCSPCFKERKVFIDELDAKSRPIPAPKREYRWIPAAVPGGKLYLE